MGSFNCRDTVKHSNSRMSHKIHKEHREKFVLKVKRSLTNDPTKN